MNALPNASDPITFANISFALDGETMGHFLRAPDASSEVLYNQLVYANASLADGLHTLVMPVSASGSNASLMFFDYLLYTTEAEATTSATTASMTAGIPIPSSVTTPSASSSSIASSAHAPTAAIVGGVVGGIALLLAAAVLLFLVSRHCRRQARPPTAERSGFVFPDAPARSTSTTTSEPCIRPLSIDLSSNAATVAGPSLAPGSESPTLVPPLSGSSSSRAFEAKREAEFRRRINIEASSSSLAQRRRDTPWDPEEERVDSEAGRSVTSEVSAGAVQELQGEIAALRDVLSAMTMAAAGTVTPRGWG
ncbi:hypothetical protein GSI_11228 [Ganoderma sinense ZZ0214-1]|uniref:Mid2 domain-containing protein n=1 Tax=Ganoderma sinense ZZ0214-1 TaxID=1077348 RepID=A0A2G8RYV5_9APHY|nr:hypothetical protein GSI_11228 [Ganoderma sinense ZZ0214-1]